MGRSALTAPVRLDVTRTRIADPVKSVMVALVPVLPDLSTLPLGARTLMSAKMISATELPDVPTVPDPINVFAHQGKWETHLSLVVLIPTNVRRTGTAELSTPV
jgi:hypothetical protein